MEIDLKSHYYLIKKRLWIIVVSALLCIAPAIFLVKDSYTPVYQASSEIMIGQAAYPQSIDYGSLGVILKSPAVLNQVIERYPDIDMSAVQLGKVLDVHKVNESQIMRIIIRDNSFSNAVKINGYVTQVAQTELPKFLNIGVKVTVLNDAVMGSNPSPINPPTNPLKVAIIAFAGSLIFSLIIIYLLDSMDETLRTEEDVRAIFETSTLAIVPKIKERRNWLRLRLRNASRTRGSSKEAQTYAASQYS